MSENQNNQEVTANQNGKKNQNYKDNQDNRRKRNDQPEKSPASDEDNDAGITNVQKEYQDKEHQHDYKTPLGEEKK